MDQFIALNKQLLRHANGEDTADFCGKLMAIMLYSGLSPEEMEQFLRTVHESSILMRVSGDSLRKIHELCPIAYGLVKDYNHTIKQGIPFLVFFRRISEY